MEDVERIAEQTVERTEESAAVERVAAGEDPPLSHLYFSINLLGFLHWGPTWGYPAISGGMR